MVSNEGHGSSYSFKVII